MPRGSKTLPVIHPTIRNRLNAGTTGAEHPGVRTRKAAEDSKREICRPNCRGECGCTVSLHEGTTRGARRAMHMGYIEFIQTLGGQNPSLSAGVKKDKRRHAKQINAGMSENG